MIISPRKTFPMDETVVTVLTVAGFDPGAGAGVQADLRTFGWMGLYGLGAVAAVTAQNSQEVRQVFPTPAAELEEQLRSILDDFKPAAVKTGMLATAANAEQAAESLEALTKQAPLVVDPVLTSTTGANLGARGLAATIRDRLAPLCRVITPNLAEAAALTDRPVTTLSQARDAAKALVAAGAGAACVTGGHLEGAPRDVLLDGDQLQILEGTRQGAGEFHGTGCLFSAAITGLLAQGALLADAVTGAKRIVERAAAAPARPGSGLPVPWLRD